MTYHPLLWTFQRAASDAVAEIQTKLPQQGLAFLMDHKIREQAVMPAVCLLEMAAAAGQVSNWQRETMVILLYVACGQGGNIVGASSKQIPWSKLAFRQ